MIYIGIDPGKKGALAFYDPSDTYQFMDMPENLENLIAYLRDMVMVGDKCILEKAQPMPKQGIVSTFTYARNYGIMIGILLSLDIKFIEVSPQTWKKKMGLTKNKRGSIEILKEFGLYKQGNFFTKRGRFLDGRAEALLLAKYGELYI